MKFNSFFTLLLFTAFAFVACENEPIEGEFVSDDPQDYIASFTADVEGTFFEAETANAVTAEGVTTITGIRDNGDGITLIINGVGVGNFDLVTEGEATFGITQDSEAFSTNNEGSQGQVAVTQYDTNLGLISGTFSFTATRPLLDANGAPILDGEGNPTFASVIISEGQFTNIPLTSDGSGPTDPVTEFYAEVDGIPFVAGEETAGAFYDEATNTLIVQGVNNDKTVRMKVLNTAEGIFDLGATNAEESMGSYLIEGENPYTSELSEGGSGSVTITTFDLENNTISGTFEFTAGRDAGAETVVIENGYFENLPLTLGDPGGETDFMNAKIDGVDFSADDISIGTTGIISIEGVDTATGESIFISFPADTEPGTYSMTFSGDINASYFDGNISYGSETGLLILNENSASLVQFSFNFQASEEEGGAIVHSISEGLFQYNL
ncbi:MAG: DUF6252 family protein [Flavobacteriaceae bacterium]